MQMSTAEINPTHTIGRASVEAQDLTKFLESAEIGQVITYAELNDAAKCDVQARNTVLQTARRNLMKPPHRMVFGTISGVGIKRLADDEIPDEGASAVKRARNIARSGLKKLNCADLAKVSGEQKIRLVTTKTVLGLFSQSSSRKTLNLAEQAARVGNGEMNVGKIETLFGK